MTALDLWDPSIPLRMTKALVDLMALGVAVGAAALLANRWLRTASASRRYLLNLALLGSLCVSLPIVLTLHLASGSRSETRWEAEPSPSIAESAAVMPAMTDHVPTTSVPLDDVAPRLAQVAPLPHPESDQSRQAADLWVSLKGVAALCIAGGYCLGVVVMVIRLLAALYGGHRLRLAARSICEPQILELVVRQSRAIGLRLIPAVAYCERVAVPVVVGILRPVILVPMSLVSTLTPRELCDVLTHELAHLRRFDHLVVVLQRAAEVLWFFHPAVWYLSRQISLEREYCCDDLALAAGVERCSYAKSLCRVAELAIAGRNTERRSLALAADGQRPSELRRRIVRLLNPRPEPTVHLTRAGLIGLAALLAGVALAPLLTPALNIRWQSLMAADEDPPTKTEPAQLPAVRGLSAPDYTNVTGYVANAALPTKAPDVLWKFTSEVGFRSVVTADGVVYLGTDDGQMIALSATDGSVVWKYAIPGRAEAVKKTESDTRKWDLTHTGPRYVLTDYFRVGKAALDKEYVYFGTPTGVTAIRRDTGTFVWHRNIEHGVLESTPLPIGQRVYVSGYDGKAYSLHRTTGHVVWAHDLVEDAPADKPGFPGKRARGQQAAARPRGEACDGKLFIQSVFDQSRIVAIDCVTGEKRWSYEMAGWPAAAPTIDEDRVYIGSQDRTLSCLSAKSGKVLWKFGAPRWLNSRVAVHAGKVYLTCNRGELFQLDAENGKTIRHFISNEDQKSYSCSPIVDDHAVYFATSNGHFFALDVDALQTAWQLRPASDSESVTDPATDGRRIFVTTQPKLSNAGEHAVIALGDPALAVKQPATPSGRQPASPRVEADDVSKHLAMVKATETRPRGIASGVSKTFSAVVMASDGTKSILLSAYWGAAPFPIGKAGLPLGPVFLRDTEEPVKVLACDERRGIGVFSVDKPLDAIPENLINEQLRPGDSLDPLQTSDDGPGKAYRVVAVDQICRHETASGQMVGVEHAVLLDRPLRRNPGSWLLKDGKLAAICLDNFRNPASKRLEGYALPIKFARQAFAQWVSANDSQPSTPRSRTSPPGSQPQRASRPFEQPASALCVDSKGQPVRGAEVHFFQFTGGDDGRYLHFGPFASDEKGHASSPETLIKNDAGNYDLWIYARVPGRLVGVGRSAQWRHDPPFNPQGRVVLHPSRSVEGKVAVPASFDPTRVLVRVRTMQIFQGSGDFDFQAFPREDNFSGLDTTLPAIFERHPDAKGQFHFSDVPIHGRLYLAATADGLGEAQWWNPNKTFDEPIAIAMQPEAVASGRVLSPDGTPAIGMKITARISSQALFDKPPMGYLSPFHSVTDNDGKFVLHGLPGTRFVLSVADPKKLWAFRPLEDLAVRSGHETILTLRMETGVLVSGRVLDNAGQPVAGAAFSALTDRDNGSSLWEDATDASGRYQFRLPAGGAKLYFNALPQGFAYPDPQIVKHLDVKTGQAEIHDLNFTLKRELGHSR
jgi:outer membrane protein assembly factor BamB/beta-lactamase regulating signal transducer with metallopeptidase domain